MNLNQNLITKHNTYLVVTRDYTQKQRLSNIYVYKKNEPKNKVEIQKRNSRIIQIGHAVKWKTFITLTFSPENYWDDLTEIQKQFRKFLKKLYYYTREIVGYRITKRNKTVPVYKSFFKYLAVLEFGEQFGRVHYHMLTDIPFENEIFEYNDHPYKKICNFWEFGWSDVSEVNNDNCNAVFYLAKYLTKDNKNRTPIGKREVFSSRGLNKIEKRIVMGNITAVKNYREFAKIGKSTIYVKNKI